jgi:hypothetical protein
MLRSIGNVVFVGTDDAHILRIDPDGAQQCLTGFNAVEGRDRWYAGAAIIDGKVDGAHFAMRGAVYRRPIDSNGPLQPLGGGMPKWIDGIADTNCIAT